MTYLSEAVERGPREYDKANRLATAGLRPYAPGAGVGPATAKDDRWT